jgi:hypothetical protein
MSCNGWPTEKSDIQPSLYQAAPGAQRVKVVITRSILQSGDLQAAIGEG